MYNYEVCMYNYDIYMYNYDVTYNYDVCIVATSVYDLHRSQSIVACVRFALDIQKAVIRLGIFAVCWSSERDL